MAPDGLCEGAERSSGALSWRVLPRRCVAVAQPQRKNSGEGPLAHHDRSSENRGFFRSFAAGGDLAIIQRLFSKLRTFSPAGWRFLTKSRDFRKNDISARRRLSDYSAVIQ